MCLYLDSIYLCSIYSRKLDCLISFNDLSTISFSGKWRSKIYYHCSSSVVSLSAEREKGKKEKKLFHVSPRNEHLLSVKSNFKKSNKVCVHFAQKIFYHAMNLTIFSVYMTRLEQPSSYFETVGISLKKLNLAKSAPLDQHRARLVGRSMLIFCLHGFLCYHHSKSTRLLQGWGKTLAAASMVWVSCFGDSTDNIASHYF